MPRAGFRKDQAEGVAKVTLEIRSGGSGDAQRHGGDALGAWSVAESTCSVVKGVEGFAMQRLTTDGT